MPESAQTTQATFGSGAFATDTPDEPESGDDEIDLSDLKGYENKWGASGNDTRLLRHPDVEAEWFRDESPKGDTDEILRRHGVERPADELLAVVLDGE